MPEFALPAPTGRIVKFADFKGRPLVINFFGSWCPSCWAEVPLMVSLYADYRGRGLGVLGIGVLDDAAAQTWMVRKLGIPYPTVYDVGGETVSNVLRLRAMPTTVLIDRRGVVKMKWEGFLDRDTLLRKVQEIL